MVVLGITDGHEAGAALLVDGEVVFAASEERFARCKRAQGFPVQSVREALLWAGLEPRDVDVVAVAGRAGRAPFRLLDSLYRGHPASRSPLALSSRLAAAYENEWARPGALLSRADEAGTRFALRARLGEAGLAGAALDLVGHHEAHLATAWLVAAAQGGEPGDGRAPCLAVSLGGFGEGLSGAVATGDGESSRIVVTIPWDRSLGVVYGIVTLILGFEEGDEGKVTGLAARGDPGPFAALFEKAIPFADDPIGWRVARRAFSSQFWKPLVQARAEDVAAALQWRVEEAVAHLVERRLDLAGARSLACAGGLFANVALNGRLAGMIRRLGGDLAVFPHMGDGGLCVGAAERAWRRRGGRRDARARMPPFWGPAYDPGRAA